MVLGERDPDGPWLLLENSAGHQGTIGVTIEELALIIDELGRPEQVGVCLDTCHLFASGIDITTADHVVETQLVFVELHNIAGEQTGVLAVDAL